MSAGTRLLFLLSFTKVDETVSVILFLTLKETINQIIPNMNKKPCKCRKIIGIQKNSHDYFSREKLSRSEKQMAENDR